MAGEDAEADPVMEVRANLKAGQKIRELKDRGVTVDNDMSEGITQAGRLSVAVDRLNQTLHIDTPKPKAVKGDLREAYEKDFPKANELRRQRLEREMLQNKGLGNPADTQDGGLTADDTNNAVNEAIRILDENKKKVPV